MDIGEQERVIVVEPLEVPDLDEIEPTEAEPDHTPEEEPVEPAVEPSENEPSA